MSTKQYNLQLFFMNEDKLESINFNNNCKSKAKEHDKTLSTYDNDSKEKTSSTPDKEDEKAVNVLNVLLNIYECSKNIFQ